MGKMKEQITTQQEGVVPERWVVVCDSRFPGGGVLFKAPAKRQGEHWTPHLHRAKRMNESQARFLCTKLRFGNPRAMKHSEAAKLYAVKIKESD